MQERDDREELQRAEENGELMDQSDKEKERGIQAVRGQW